MSGASYNNSILIKSSPFTAMIYSAKDKKTEEAPTKAAPAKAPVEPVESSPNNSPAYRTRSRARKVIDE